MASPPVKMLEFYLKYYNSISNVLCKPSLSYSFQFYNFLCFEASATAGGMLYIGRARFGRDDGFVGSLPLRQLFSPTLGKPIAHGNGTPHEASRVGRAAYHCESRQKR